MKYLLPSLMISVVSVFLNPAAANGLAAETRKIPIPISDGQQIEATVKLPGNLRPGQKVPVFMIFGGFESAGKALELIHPDRPVALASFDYPFLGPRQLRIRDTLQTLSEAKRLFPQTVQGIMSLVAALQKQPEIDPHEIVAIGASFGAPFVLAAAARCPDISKIVLVHGFGQVPRTAEHIILRSWLPKYGWISRPAAWMISRLGWLFLQIEDPEVDARKLHAQQNVLMITAEDDSFIPRQSSDSLWSAIESSRAKTARIMMPGDHLMPGADQLIERIMHQVEIWFESSAKLKPF